MENDAGSFVSCGSNTLFCGSCVCIHLSATKATKFRKYSQKIDSIGQKWPNMSLCPLQGMGQKQGIVFCNSAFSKSIWLIFWGVFNLLLMMMTMMALYKARELVEHYWTRFCPGPLSRESQAREGSELDSEMSMSHRSFTSFNVSPPCFLLPPISLHGMFFQFAHFLMVRGLVKLDEGRMS